MKLQEYRSKEILAHHGVPLLAGETATTPEEARAAAERIGGPVVVKAQVLVGGRGKAGGVKLAATPDEAAARARDILGMDIKGITVRTVLVAPAAEIAKEYYLGLILDRAAKAITIIASAEGGVEIEETARTNPEAILRLPLHPLLGLQDHDVRRTSFFLGLPAELRKDFATVLRGLYAAFVGADADLAEINPLVVTDDGRLLALDAKIVLDDSALYRHPDLEAMRDLNEEEPAEIAAREAGISFIKLDGEHRLHGERRRPGDDDDGPREARRRRARQLPRHRRRGEGRQGDGRVPDHPRRPQRARDPHQHLRRHHPWRRGRARHRRGARQHRARGADGGAASWARTARRPGRSSPRRTSSPPTRSTTRRRKAVAAANGATA